MPKITKKMQRDVIKDIRRQLVWINNAIAENNLDVLDELANQLSATALNLTIDALNEEAGI
jgi:hypothetical protein